MERCFSEQFFLPETRLLATASMENTKKMTGSVQSLTFSRRATLLGGASLGIGVVLLARMGYISVVENSRFKLLSESNRVNFTLIPPRRGWLLDRNETPIANNKADFRVDLNPSRVKDKETTVATLSKLLRLNTEEVRRINTELVKTNLERPSGILSAMLARHRLKNMNKILHLFWSRRGTKLARMG